MKPHGRVLDRSRVFQSYFAGTETSAPIPEHRPQISMESPAFDTFDSIIHLENDHPEVVLEAEDALFGDVTGPNSMKMEATLTGIFERVFPTVQATRSRVTETAAPEPEPEPGYQTGFGVIATSVALIASIRVRRQTT